MNIKILTILFLAAIIGFAQPTIWNGTADISWYNSRDTMFFISTAEQLAGLAQLTAGGNHFNRKTIRLTADIWLNDTTGWQNWNVFSPRNQWIPINRFNGVFDGNNHFVYGMYINSRRSGQKGFFGRINNSNAVVQNLALSHFYIRNFDKYTGGIVGYICCGSIINNAVNGIVIGDGYVGGIAGYAKSRNGNISENLVFARISGRKRVGGLVGYVDRKNVISNQFSGTVLNNNRNSRNLFGGIGRARVVAGNLFM
ncbi:MAG: hypothetical protein FWE23_10410 [Chitinivibrionia bacterium]|nr:hypothetical protein [Chitinivibrionia bacterium]